jgi:tyrosyl-tRNA synthetase
MGRDLQGQYGQEEQVGLFMPILPGLDGVQKMSKSLGNYVGITELPKDMFGKLMSISDELMPQFFELCTDVPLDEIEQMKTDLATGKSHPMDLKKRLAREIVTIYHFSEAAVEAQAEFERVFSQGETPDEMPELRVSQADLEDGKIWVVKLLTSADMAPSNSEARRLVQQGGVTLDGDKISDPRASVEPRDGQVLRAGKLKFARIKVG